MGSGGSVKAEQTNMESSGSDRIRTTNENLARKHSKTSDTTNQGSWRKHSETTQGTSRKHSETTKGTSRNHSETSEKTTQLLSSRTNIGKHSNAAVKLSLCYLCKKPFEDPRILPCYHTFCCKCLEEYIMSYFIDMSIKCPLCSLTVSLSEKGAKGFEKAVILENTSKLNCDACRTKGVGIVGCPKCKQILCRKCNFLHSEDDATRGHKIYTVNNTDRRTSQFCNMHPSMRIDLFCVECKTGICELCNVTKHELHKTQDMESIVREVKHSLTRTLEQPDLFQNIQHAEYQMKKELFRVQNQKKDALFALEQHTKHVNEMITNAKAELTTELLAIINSSDSKLKKTATELVKLKSSVYNRYHYAEKFLNKASHIDMATHGIKLIKFLKESLKEQISVETTEKVGFEGNNVKTSDVERLFGKIYPRLYQSNFKKEPLKITSTFSCSQSGCLVTGLAPMADNTVWVCAGNDGTVEHFNQRGKMLSKIGIGYPVDDITRYREGSICISCSSRKEILSISRHKKVKRFVNTPHCARGLTIDKDDNCIVGLTEKPVFFDTSTSKAGYVSCISKVRQMSPYLISKSIRYPGRIAVNTNHSVVISDWVEMAVFVFEDGKTIGCYKGNPSVADGFIPRGVCCTTDGDIIVVDIGSNCLHLLSCDASFIRVLLELEKIYKPWSVAFDEKNRLWIGTQNGQVYIANI